MLLKYVEKSGRPSDRVAWTIRQTLVYQRLESHHQSHVLLRASSTLQRRIQKEILEKSDSTETKYGNHWTNFSSLLVSTLPFGWAEYIKWLDLQVWDLVSGKGLSSTCHPLVFSTYSIIGF